MLTINKMITSSGHPAGQIKPFDMGAHIQFIWSIRGLKMTDGRATRFFHRSNRSFGGRPVPSAGVGGET